MTSSAEPPEGDAEDAAEAKAEARPTEAAPADTPEAPAEAPPAKPESPAHAEAPAHAEVLASAGGPEEIPAGAERAAKPRGRYRWLKVVGAVTAFFVLLGAAGLWYLYQQLNGNITTDHVTENELQAHASERPSQGPTSAENILLIGSDNRGDGNGKYGEDSGTQRSDTVILLHIAADRHSATAMSIPRDLMAQVPACTKPKGGETEPKFEQFNWAYQFGGAACTIRTVEDMTGIRIDHHLIVDFSGFKKIVNAIHGVDVCLPEPVHDKQAHLDLPAGRQTLNGEQALGYVRARHGLGDGSDTERMDRQQGFLGSLFSKVTSNGVLLNPTKVYPVLNAATSSLTADPGLDSLPELYDLAREVQGIPADKLKFLTLPREQYVLDRNRDQLQQPAANELFATLRDDLPVTVTADGHAESGSAKDSPTTPGSPSATPTGTATTAPTYRGTTAAADICGKTTK
ncbi:LCP family protein [Streptomyces sp. NRRL F-5123]|uniref:LCP family protein n=1 Tax=Streptomyces sp. NRRL F-5123 TaxID=1463856 RepID=UPI0004E278CD|nr:LCP family protein [Streptomyces sp. NRRL F-5123]